MKGQSGRCNTYTPKIDSTRADGHGNETKRINGAPAGPMRLEFKERSRKEVCILAIASKW